MQNQDSIADTDLLRMLREGNETAFSILYHRYTGLLYIHAHKKLGEREVVLDILQEIFTELWERRQLLEITHLPAYLYQAVRFKIIDYLGKSNRAKRHLDSLSDFVRTYSDNTDHRVRERIFADIIQQEIASLPPKMRRVFELSRMEGLSHKEIATMLELSEQSVRSHIKNALRILRGRLGFHFLLLLLLNTVAPQ